MKYIDKENRLLRPYNLFEPSPGKGFEIYKTSKNINIGVLNLMGNVFMKKCEDVFMTAKKFLKDHLLKENYDLLVVDFHGEITSEKNAIGHFFDGKATLVVGTHTHIPTNDARILKMVQLIKQMLVCVEIIILLLEWIKKIQLIDSLKKILLNISLLLEKQL